MTSPVIAPAKASSTAPVRSGGVVVGEVAGAVEEHEGADAADDQVSTHCRTPMRKETSIPRAGIQAWVSETTPPARTTGPCRAAQTAVAAGTSAMT